MAHFDSGTIGPGEAWGHVFDVPGTYRYHCSLHPAESGTVVVEAAKPTPSGATAAPTPPAGTLPPNFSPFPSGGVAATVAPSVSASIPSSVPSVTTTAPALTAPIVAVAAVLALVLVLLLARHRRR